MEQRAGTLGHSMTPANFENEKTAAFVACASTSHINELYIGTSVVKHTREVEQLE